MKFGAEPKKVAILVALLVVALVVYFMNRDSVETPPATATTATAPPPALPLNSPGAARDPSASTTASTAKKKATMEFRPKVRSNRPEERPDPMSIDPTLRVDLITRLQSVTVTGTHRSLFDFAQGPPPKVDAPKPGVAKAKVPSPISPIATPAQIANAEPPKPQAPPIPLKFYGYVNPAGDARKRAFFMEGEEIHVVTEGDTVKRRYRIVRIGVNSAVVEDLDFKSQQTLPLEEPPGNA